MMFKSVHNSAGTSMQHGDSTILDNERKAMEAQAKKKQKELEQKMRHEQTMAEI